MTLRELIDALIKYEAAHPQVADSPVGVEMDTDGTKWWGAIDRIDRDEDGQTTIRAYVP